MKQTDISDLPLLASTRLERLFNIHKDSNGVYFYNLLNTINFSEDMSPDIYENYTVQGGDTYAYISYKKYKTIDLWWLICTFNNIQNSTIMPQPGTQLKILNKDLINNILNAIN